MKAERRGTGRGRDMGRARDAAQDREPPTDAVTPEFSRPVVVERLRPGRTAMAIEATAAECQALAERFDLVAISDLRAELSLTPIAGGTVRLEGRLSAAVVQTCVVTLEPLPADVDEAFTLTYTPEEDLDAPTEEIVLDPDEEPVEPLVGGMIDVGEAVAEHLALALDPFPRKPDAVFTLPAAAGGDGSARSPFDVLATLKPGKKPE